MVENSRLNPNFVGTRSEVLLSVVNGSLAQYEIPNNMTRSELADMYELTVRQLNGFFDTYEIEREIPKLHRKRLFIRMEIQIIFYVLGVPVKIENQQTNE